MIGRRFGDLLVRRKVPLVILEACRTSDLSDADLKATARRVLKLAKARGLSTEVQSDPFHAKAVPADSSSEIR